MFIISISEVLNFYLLPHFILHKSLKTIDIEYLNNHSNIYSIGAETSEWCVFMMRMRCRWLTIFGILP
ncbi:hypothetical protein QTP88_014632 [Uroleucon formosanum]